MDRNPDFDHDFDKRLAVLEERMKTQLAKNESAIDRLRADIANFKTDAEKRDKEAAHRETRLILAVAVIVGIGLTIFGFLTS